MLPYSGGGGGGGGANMLLKSIPDGGGGGTGVGFIPSSIPVEIGAPLDGGGGGVMPQGIMGGIPIPHGGNGIIPIGFCAPSASAVTSGGMSLDTFSFSTGFTTGGGGIPKAKTHVPVFSVYL